MYPEGRVKSERPANNAGRASRWFSEGPQLRTDPAGRDTIAIEIPPNCSRHHRNPIWEFRGSKGQIIAERYSGSQEHRCRCEEHRGCSEELRSCSEELRSCSEELRSCSEELRSCSEVNWWRSELRSSRSELREAGFRSERSGSAQESLAPVRERLARTAASRVRPRKRGLLLKKIRNWKRIQLSATTSLWVWFKQIGR